MSCLDMDPLMIAMLPVPVTLINPVVELNLSVFTSRRNVSLELYLSEHEEGSRAF